MANILDTIVAEKQREIARLSGRAITVAQLREAIARRGDPRNFFAALQQPRTGSPALIAEVKKASPSAGVICPNFDPVRIALDYERGGASCLSVLTDEKFFQGSLDNLRKIRDAVQLPLLRKDFIIDERQILEAVEHGADAILLIVAILDDSRLRRFHELATGAGLAALVEVHDEGELNRALALEPTLLGVNNRDLATFRVDLATTSRLAEKALGPSRRTLPLLVSESGIHTHADVLQVKKAGARAILVGESLSKHADIPEKIRDLLGNRA